MEPFCVYHIRTLENPNGTDCSAHLNEARCFKCPYTTEDVQYGIVFGNRPEFYISKTKGNPFLGGCLDFEPCEGLIVSLSKKLEKTSENI